MEKKELERDTRSMPAKWHEAGVKIEINSFPVKLDGISA